MNKDIQIQSINIKGKPEKLVADHQSTMTSFKKESIGSSSIYLTKTGFIGDSVHHTAHHGGNDKAICCYSAVHFPYWNAKLGLDLVHAAFGENLTLEGDNSLEENIFIGDRYQLGEAIVEVSEPRVPCFIIGIRHNYKLFSKLCQYTGFTGFYLRTIEEGRVYVSDGLKNIYAHPEKISVRQVNQIRYYDNKNFLELQRLVNLKELTLEWREKFEMLLNKIGS